LMSFVIFIGGNMSSVTDSLTSNKNPATKVLANILHFLLPNFGNFNIQNKLIHPEVKLTNENIFITQNIVYSLIYSAVLLILAILVFDRREV